MIRLTTLGSVRVYRDNREVPDLPAQRLRCALLVYLATERDVSRADVVAMFWPERDTGRGKHALRQMLYELRHVLGDDGLELRRDRIRCSVAMDASDFERAGAEGRTADALELYAGPFLYGFSLENGAFEGWVERRRAHYGRLHRRLQREHIAALQEAGDADAALSSARRWVELDPLEDEAAHSFIRQLAMMGRRTEALQYFESYQKQLSAELDVQPLDETLALVAGIREGAAHPAGRPGDRPATALDTESALLHPSLRPMRPVASNPGLSTTSAHSPATPSRQLSRFVALLRRPAARRMLTTVLVVIAGASLALYAYPREQRPGAPSRTLRIAVASVSDGTTDGSLRGIADELTEQLTSALGQSSVLEIVLARELELGDGVKISADSVARQSGADYLVGGSMVMQDGRVRLDLVLRDGRTGRVVRSDVVERSWSEAQNLVNDVVTSAATVLRTELGTALELQRVRASAGSQQAWSLLIEGKQLMSQMVPLVRATQHEAAVGTLARADSVLMLAQSIDPRWSEPLVQRAWIRHRRAMLLRHFLEVDPDDIADCTQEGLKLAEEALARSPNDVGAHEVRGVLLLQHASEAPLPADSVRRLHRAAERALRRAVELEPRRQTALRHLAELLHLDERYGEAHVVAAEAHRADPYGHANALLVTLFQSTFEAWEDELADSWCMAGRYRFRDPPFTWCLLVQHAWGTTSPDPGRLRREIDNVPPIVFRVQPALAQRFDAMLAAAFARANEPDSARAILRRLDGSDHEDLTWLRAAAYVQLGEDSVAIELLRTLPPTLTNLRVMRQRAFSKLRRDPEFQRLAQRAPE
jgi:DNA-binding SARP family transcriptional activator/TolB-like protein